jgi:hypothetical protein
MPPHSVQLPIYRRRELIGYTLIDADDWAWASTYRWHLNPHGYVYRCRGPRSQQEVYSLAREILGLPRKYDGQVPDHKNRNRLDNRRANLRILTPGQNVQNTSGRTNSTSRYRGVSWHAARQKWRARLCVNGRQIDLGRFDSEREAAIAATAARRAVMPYSVESPDWPMHLEQDL